MNRKNNHGQWREWTIEDSQWYFMLIICIVSHCAQLCISYEWILLANEKRLEKIWLILQIGQMRKRNCCIIIIRACYCWYFPIFNNIRLNSICFMLFISCTLICAILSFMFVYTQNGVCFLASEIFFGIRRCADDLAVLCVILIGKAVGLLGRLHISCKNLATLELLYFRIQTS